MRRNLYSALVAFVAVRLCSSYNDPSWILSHALPTSTATDADTWTHLPPTVYKTTHAQAPALHFAKTHPLCHANGVFVLETHKTTPEPPSLYIIDTYGEPIWIMPHDAAPEGTILANPDVQVYKGERVLTYFEGVAGLGYGSGVYHILNDHYQVLHTVTGVNATADGHELIITANNTAIFTSYVLRPHPSYAAQQVLDSGFQEIDLETNALLFSWYALDHFNINDVLIDSSTREGASVFDWWHINSVDKDSLGNYLISGRYASALFYIDGETGKVIWTLGGIGNQFVEREVNGDGDVGVAADGDRVQSKDAAGHWYGTAVDFYCQHSARWISKRRQGEKETGDGVDDAAVRRLALFDNGARWGSALHPSRGMILDINTAHRTVTLALTIEHPEPQWSESQGSIQHLANGHYVLGYGYAPGFAEFDEDGTLLCDVQIDARPKPEAHTRDAYVENALGSSTYRVMKREWKGCGWGCPDVLLREKERQVYVSWNGDTEVGIWSVGICRALACEGEGDVVVAGKAVREGFETCVEVDPGGFERFDGDTRMRLTALAKGVGEIGTWEYKFAEPDDGGEQGRKGVCFNERRDSTNKPALWGSRRKGRPGADDPGRVMPTDLPVVLVIATALITLLLLYRLRPR